jgi:hypothetical protein
MRTEVPYGAQQQATDACHPTQYETVHSANSMYLFVWHNTSSRLHLKRDGARPETRFRLSPKRTSPFKSAGASVQSTAESRGVRISVSNAGYTTFRGSVRVLATHSTRQFPLHFPSRASPCPIRFQTHSTNIDHCPDIRNWLVGISDMEFVLRE